VRARLGGVLCLVVAAVSVGALAPASVSAEAAIPIPVTVLYEGSYEYHETAEKAGAVVSYVNQKVTWSWYASGSVPVSLDGSRAYGVENLPGTLSVSGASSGGASNCFYSAGAGASAPIRISLLDDHGTLQAGYGLGIPGAAATCGGQASSPTDVLDCDFNSCDAGICPGAPPAVSTARFQTDVLTAFQPTTSYLKTGYVPLATDEDHDLGWSDKDYDLPADTGSVSSVCGSNPQISETETVSLTSYVVVDLNSKDNLNVDFPNSLPPTPLTDLIALHPSQPSNPSVSVPPEVPQLPDYPGLGELARKLVPENTTPSGSNPSVGIISVRCPRQDRRCEGTVSVAATGGDPRGVLGRRSYSLPGGEDEILNVGLESSAGVVLNRVGRLRVRVTVNSYVMPGSRRASGHRTVLLTTFPSVPGVPSP
jgi:hypothetical protein